MTLVCRRDLQGLQPLMLSAKQGGIGSHFFVFGMTRPGIEPPISQSQGGHSNHKATVLVEVLYNFLKGPAMHLDTG